MVFEMLKGIDDDGLPVHLQELLGLGAAVHPSARPSPNINAVVMVSAPALLIK